MPSRFARHVVLMGALLALGALGACGASKHATPGTSTTRSSRPRTAAVALIETADEYETADGKAINGSNGALCPPSRDVPSIDAKCWTWSAKGLGHGTYTQTIGVASGAVIPFTFTLRDVSGDTLSGAGTARLVPDPTTPVHALGHVNRFPPTITFTRGTGRFAGVTGTLTGEDRSTVVGVDEATGIVHKTGGPTTYTGTVTFSPRR